MIFLKEIHIVDNLKTNFLIDMNIIISEKIDIFIFQLKVFIDNYDLFILIEIRIKNDHIVMHSIYMKKFIIISSYSQI